MARTATARVGIPAWPEGPHATKVRRTARRLNGRVPGEVYYVRGYNGSEPEILVEMPDGHFVSAEDFLGPEPTL